MDFHRKMSKEYDYKHKIKPQAKCFMYVAKSRDKFYKQ